MARSHRSGVSGGKDTLDNLVCAAFCYNSKKLNNGRDKNYLFRDGKPTDEFFWTHGEVSVQQAALLKRNAHLTEADWYFNRVLGNLSVALENDVAALAVARTRDYWLGSARKRLAVWRRLSAPVGISSFGRRGLIRYPSSPDVRLMLSLATVDDRQILNVYRQLLVHYRANCKTMTRFCRARNEPSAMQFCPRLQCPRR